MTLLYVTNLIYFFISVQFLLRGRNARDLLRENTCEENGADAGEGGRPQYRSALMCRERGKGVDQKSSFTEHFKDRFNKAIKVLKTKVLFLKRPTSCRNVLAFVSLLCSFVK